MQLPGECKADILETKTQCVSPGAAQRKMEDHLEEDPCEKTKVLTVVVKNCKVSEEASNALNDANLEVREGNQLPCDEAVCGRVSRLAAHDVGLLVLPRH